MRVLEQLARHLEFGKIARLGMTTSLIGAGCGLAAALLGMGIWTFPIQVGASALCQTVGVWIVSGWRPRGRFDLRPARGLAKFGSLLALSGLLEIAYSNGYPLILGRLYGVREIGFFNRGQNLQSLPSNIISGVVQRVLFPTLSSNLDDRAALKSSTKLAIRSAMVVNIPAMLFLAFFSDLIIGVLFGAKWLPSAPVLTILAVGGILFPLHVINLQVILAQGKSGLFFRLEVLKKVLGIALVVIGCFYGMIGLAVSQLVFVVIAFFINSNPSRKLIDYSSFEQLKDVAGPFALSSAVMVALKVAEPFLAANDLLRLAVLLLSGGTIYLAAALALKVGPIHEVVGIARTQLAGGR